MGSNIIIYADIFLISIAANYFTMMIIFVSELSSQIFREKLLLTEIVVVTQKIFKYALVHYCLCRRKG